MSAASAAAKKEKNNMNKITKKHILVIVLLVVLGAGLVLGAIFGLKALQTQMNLKRVEVLATIDPETALNELKDTGVVNDDLSAYLSVLVLTRQAMDTELSDAAAMDKISQLISSAETALELGVLSEEHLATVEALLSAGGDPTRRDKRGLNAIDLAAAQNDCIAMQMLLAALDEDTAHETVSALAPQLPLSDDNQAMLGILKKYL